MLDFEVNMRRSSKKTIDQITVSYKGEVLDFYGKGVIKLEKSEKDVTQESNLFDCLNDYVDACFTDKQKAELFKAYKELHSQVESTEEESYGTDLLKTKPIINKILEQLDVTRYTQWIAYSKYLVIPKGLTEAATKGDYPMQTTVTSDDYVSLVMLSFVVRAIFPGVFSLENRFAKQLGEDTAELVCGSLIKDSPHITNLPGWHKLCVYVSYIFEKRGVPTSVLDVTSGENFIEKVIFNAIFNRLCMSVIPETEVGKNIATTIHATVRQHESVKSNYRAKEARMNDDQDKRSIYESYGISEDIKQVDFVMQAEFFSFGLRDENDKERFKNRFTHQCKALGIKNEELVERVFDNLPINWDFFLYDHILKILQLVYVGEVTHLVFESCNYEQLMAAIVLAQVKLSEEGYEYLPSILGAIDDPKGMVTYSESFKFTTEEREYLASICDVQSRNSEGTSYNEAVEAAVDFLDGLSTGKWQSNLEYGVLSNPEIYKRVKQGALFQIDVEIGIKQEFLKLIKSKN